jgi:hypothetical protein
MTIPVAVPNGTMTEEEQSWSNWSTIPAFTLEGMRKTTRNLSLDFWCPNQNLNQVPSKFNSKSITATPSCQVHDICQKMDQGS